MATRHRGTVLSRVSSQLFSSGGAPFLELNPSWAPGGTLDQVLADAAKAVGTAPRDADIDVSTGWVRLTPEKAGRALDVEASKRSLMQGVALGDDVVRLVTSATKAQADPALSKVILVRAGENKLYLYDNGQIVKSWPVATGSAAYLTPPGLWRVVEKDLNPSWYNPGSAWATGLPKVIGPGPSNPLGTKALALDAPGILIHATPDATSVGYSVSHGCIRMTEADEAELFSQVPVGTRVAVVQAAPPRPRGTPAADQSAAVIY
jgi:lipoprotein-anchoring transpeptidase ErfK/SrfK